MIAEVPVKHGEAPWFLMWSSALLFAFGMVWAWLADIGAARSAMVLDLPARSTLLVGGGVLGTVLGQSGMLWAWRRYVRATENDLRPGARSSPRSETAPVDEPPPHEVTKKRVEERA
ncbi:MAG: hypothetical protein HY616_06110 [Candidatus Rokubacteria bacterium]|nr:hypothetical protein [Candidatus Rokubacteria bacterium]